jgi:ABC-type transport system substrate-binding protein
MRCLVLSLLLLGALDAQKTVRLPLHSEARTIDPAATRDPQALWVAAQVLESPLALEVAPGGGWRVGPGLCRELPSPRPGRVLVLEVVADATFSPSGEAGARAVLAEDVRRSLMRHADPAWSSPWWSVYLAGLIEGLDAWRERALEDGLASYDLPVAGLTAEGRRLTITLNRASAEFRALLTQPWAGVVPLERVRDLGTGFGERQPSGSGPFRVERRSERTWHLRRRTDGRHGEKNPGVARLEFHHVTDEGEALRLFRTGGLDVCDLGAASLEAVLDRKGRLERGLRRRARLVEGPAFEVGYLFFDARHPQLRHAWLRRALSWALDRAAIARALPGAGALPSLSPLPQGLPSGQRAHAACTLRDGPGRAARALERNGHPGGEGLSPLLLDVPGELTDPVRAAARRIVADWARLGLEARIRNEPYALFERRVRGGQVQVAWVSWWLDYPDPLNILRLFHSEEAQNFGRFASEAYDSRFARVLELPCGEERDRGIDGLVRLVHEEAPWAPLLHHRRAALVRRGLRGYRPGPLAPSLRDLRWEE